MIAIAIIPLAIVLSLAAIGYWGERWTVAAQPAQLCGDERMQEHVRSIMNEALDVALQAHIQSLFVVLMKEVQADGKADRATAGVRVGVNSYLRGRELVASWRLPLCR